MTDVRVVRQPSPGLTAGGAPPGAACDAAQVETDTGSAAGDDLSRLWAALRAGDEGARAALVTAYYPLVKHIARRTWSSVSRQVELDDLEGYGAIGLLDAVDRYDAVHGAQFATFAAHRIRGAIYDGMRRVDWAPRSVRRREREIQANFAWLCTEHGREPTESEEAGALGLGVDALRSAKHHIRDAHVGSLESRPGDDAGAALDPRDPGAEPLELYLASETADTLRAGLDTLDERERAVTTLSFDEGLTLAEIGARLGVTESRVCQIRAGAIKRLRAYARAQGMAT
jgi:RNA polymerase sigma factor for flagellar operon FliA